jgi:hypothetical protein
VIIKLKVEGTEYEWDSDRLLVAEARELKVLTGFTPPRWMAALDEQDPDAMAALIYLAKKRAGESLRFSDLDTLDYHDFDFEVVAPEADQEPSEQTSDGTGQPDPTPVSGESGPTTPTPDTSPTSEPSPTTSSTGPGTSAS